MHVLWNLHERYSNIRRFWYFSSVTNRRRRVLLFPLRWEANKPQTAEKGKREKSPRTGLHGVTVGKRERAEQAAINSSLHPAEAREKSQHRKNATTGKKLTEHTRENPRPAPLQKAKKYTNTLSILILQYRHFLLSLFPRYFLPYAYLMWYIRAMFSP